jgi:hypothetical protein
MSNQLNDRKGKVMKKLYTMMMMAVMGLMTISLTSCEDERIANTLEGTWKGNMYIACKWDGREYDATYTEITFLKDPSRYSSGSGYWVDYYSGAPWDYVANHINWRVDYGTIYVNFVEEGASLAIRDYHLTSSRFWGYISDGGNDVEFELYCVDRPNYYNYRWGFDYNGYRSYTRGNGADSTKTVEMPKRFVRP